MLMSFKHPIDKKVLLNMFLMPKNPFLMLQNKFLIHQNSFLDLKLKLRGEG